jgi:hypothetical protein
MPEKTYTEEFQVNGEELLEKIKELVHAGNIRRILIRNQEGRTLIDIRSPSVWWARCLRRNWRPSGRSLRYWAAARSWLRKSKIKPRG